MKVWWWESFITLESSKDLKFLFENKTEKKAEPKSENKAKINQINDSIKPTKNKAINSINKSSQKGKKIIVWSDASYRGDEKSSAQDANIIRMSSNRTSNEISILIK